MLKILTKLKSYSKSFYVIGHILEKIPAICFCVFMVYSFMLLADKSPPADLSNGRIVGLVDGLETDPVPNHDIIVKWDTFRHKTCDVIYLQSIYDKNNTRYPIPSYLTSGKRQTGKTVEFRLNVPFSNDIPRGPATYVSTRRYFCNFIDDIFPRYVDNDTIHFEIK